MLALGGLFDYLCYMIYYCFMLSYYTACERLVLVIRIGGQPDSELKQILLC